MRRTRRGQLLRSFTLASVVLCAAAWAWSYYRPAGVGRAGNDTWIVDSDRGSVVVARLSTSYFLRFSGPHWGIFFDRCAAADWGTLAKAWLGRRPLGFGFGFERAPTPEPTWTLDQYGNPIQTGWAIRPSKHRQFAAVVPWWSIVTAALFLSAIVWPRTKGRQRAFPICSASGDSAS